MPNAPAAVPAGTSAELLERLIVENMPLVGHLVREALAKVPSHVSHDELSSAGMMALVVSARNFDQSRGVPFPRFAAIRIRGAIMDELRSMDWAVRSVRTRAREVDNVRSQLCAVLARTPRPDEVAAALGISVAELDAVDADVARAGVLSLQGFVADSADDLLVEPAAGPETVLLQREQLDHLYDAIRRLPKRLQTVVTGYFFEERKMTDIAAELGVTESRVSQMRAEAVRLLRDQTGAQLIARVTRPSAAPSPARAGYKTSVQRAARESRRAVSDARPMSQIA